MVTTAGDYDIKGAQKKGKAGVLISTTSLNIRANVSIKWSLFMTINAMLTHEKLVVLASLATHGVSFTCVPGITVKTGVMRNYVKTLGQAGYETTTVKNFGSRVAAEVQRVYASEMNAQNDGNRMGVVGDGNHAAGEVLRMHADHGEVIADEAAVVGAHQRVRAAGQQVAANVQQAGAAQANIVGEAQTAAASHQAVATSVTALGQAKTKIAGIETFVSALTMLN
ncbi:MAG: hypothetical protein LBK01_05390 [Burkholderiaceae bacterium]|jgi:hypothetical protein|nr:hypothetical protein [Burkholderiaceae bacterium]